MAINRLGFTVIRPPVTALKPAYSTPRFAAKHRGLKQAALLLGLGTAALGSPPAARGQLGPFGPDFPPVDQVAQYAYQYFYTPPPPSPQPVFVSVPAPKLDPAQTADGETVTSKSANVSSRKQALKRLMEAAQPLQPSMQQMFKLIFEGTSGREVAADFPQPQQKEALLALLSAQEQAEQVPKPDRVTRKIPLAGEQVQAYHLINTTNDLIATLGNTKPELSVDFLS